METSIWQKRVAAWVRSRFGDAVMTSPEVFAIRRRRRSAAIAQMFRDLSAQKDRKDFHSYTYPVFDAVRSLHDELFSKAERTEGNTLMMLRYVRNSMVGQRANEQYRNPATAEAIAEIFDLLSSAVKVTYSDTRNTFRAVFAAGLRPSLAVELENDEDG